MSIPYPYSRGMNAAMAEVKKLPGLPYMGTVEAIVATAVDAAILSARESIASDLEQRARLLQDRWEDYLPQTLVDVRVSTIRRAARIVRGEEGNL